MTKQKTENILSNALLSGMLFLLLGYSAPEEESYDATGTLKDYVSYFNESRVQVINATEAARCFKVC